MCIRDRTGRVRYPISRLEATTTAVSRPHTTKSPILVVSSIQKTFVKPTLSNQSTSVHHCAATEIGLFVVCGLLTAVVVASSLLIGYRTRPVYPPISAEQQNLDHYRELLEPLRRLATVAAPAVLGIFAGSAGASQWQTFLLWANRVPFGSKDAQFG